MKRILALLISGLFILCGLFSNVCAAMMEGSSPALAGPTLDGGAFDLAELKGKVVIVHFWATWCPSCLEEMPVLEDFYLHQHSHGVEVIAVSVNNRHERDSVLAVMQHFHFPASLVGETKSNDLGVPGALPITYVIDSQGIVRATLTPDKGKLTKASLKDVVLPLTQK